MDAFAAIMLGGVALLLCAVVLLGVFYPGSGAEQVGWKSPREHDDAERSLDQEDLAQMLEAANRRRRARGERELTVEGLQMDDDLRGL
jgi:hypothetical protein